MFEPYLLRPKRHSSSDRLLNIFKPTRTGPDALLVSMPSPRTELTIWCGTQGPLCDFGPLPLQQLLKIPVFLSHSRRKCGILIFIGQIITIP